MNTIPMHKRLGLIIAASLIAHNAAFAATQDPQLDKQLNAFWSAQSKRDWGTVYDLLPAKQQATTTKNQYSELRNKTGIFDFTNVKIQDMEIIGDLAWVKINFDAQITRFPTAKPRHVSNWQLWQKTDTWHPVTEEDKQNLPSLPPKLRIIADEKTLAARAQTAWTLKTQQDWKSFYNFLSPAYKAVVSQSDFLKKKAQYIYSATHIDWSEVPQAKKDQGFVKITFSIKPNDLSVSKLDAQQKSMVENWIKQNDEWYFNIPLPPGANKAASGAKP